MIVNGNNFKKYDKKVYYFKYLNLVMVTYQAKGQFYMILAVLQ